MAKSVFVQKLQAEDAQSDLDVCALKVTGKKVGGTFLKKKKTQLRWPC